MPALNIEHGSQFCNSNIGRTRGFTLCIEIIDIARGAEAANSFILLHSLAGRILATRFFNNDMAHRIIAGILHQLEGSCLSWS